jgi:hypothetical protein
MSRVEPPPDPRLAPLIELRRIIPLVDHDAEEREGRRVLHRRAIEKAVRE